MARWDEYFSNAFQQGLNRAQQQNELNKRMAMAQQEQSAQDKFRQWQQQQQGIENQMGLMKMGAVSPQNPAQYMDLMKQGYNETSIPGMGDVMFPKQGGAGRQLIEYDPISGQMRTVGSIDKGDIVRNKQQDPTARNINEVDKKLQIDYDSRASNALTAKDSFNSLKSTYYAGFNPVKINLDDATIFDALGAKGSGAWNTIMASVGLNPEAKAFLNQVKGFATTISRGGLGEKGTLTDMDRKVVVDMFNMALANKDEADYAFNTIENVLAKPVYRAAAHRIKKFKSSLEDTELPTELKNKVKSMAEKTGKTDLEVLNYLIDKDYSTRRKNAKK